MLTKDKPNKKITSMWIALTFTYLNWFYFILLGKIDKCVNLASKAPVGD
jgi:hypothetical protein